MTLLLIAVPASAEDWWVAETDHFMVKSRDSERETREFAEELERYDGALRLLQNMDVEGEVGPANKVTIFRFGDSGAIAVMAGAPGSGIAGFYIPRAGASVAFVPANEDRRSRSILRRGSSDEIDGMTVLKHEYAHHFMMQYFPGAYPRWYVEGYAELVATIRFLDDGSFHVGDPPQHRAYQVLQMRSFPLNEMLDANHELTGLEGLQHYGTGWLLSHFLNFDDQGRAQLSTFLQALAQGEDSLTAARRIFGDLGELQRKLMSYRHGQFPGLNVKPANFVEPRITMRLLTPDEAAFINEEMLLRRGVDQQKAVSIGKQIAARLDRYPDSPQAHLLLAEASLAAKDYDGAEEAAKLAIALAPDSLEGWLYRGMAAMEQAARDNEEVASDDALPGLAREYLAHAASLDRTDPRPLIAYYETYLSAGEVPTDQAILALEQAYDHSGSDEAYRMLLARQLLSEEQFSNARTVVMPVAFSGHATGEADAEEDDPTPTKLLDAIDAHDVTAATLLIDGLLDKLEEEDD
jgi:tetratricopeptide (TPR) repeat protein